MLSQKLIERQELYDSGLTDDEMAEIQQVSRTTIVCWRKKRKYPPNIKTYDFDKVKQLYFKGLTNNEISKTLNVPIYLIRQWQKENGYKNHKSKKNICKRIDRNKVLELHELNLSANEISKKINCSVSTVRRILKEYNCKKQNVTLSPAILDFANPAIIMKRIHNENFKARNEGNQWIKT